MNHNQRPTRFEQLENRNLLASVWQASPNRYDVDGTGFVVPSDALLVINDLNQNGNRQLPASLPTGYQGAMCDVNGDGLMSPSDALQVINILDQVSPTASIDVNLSSFSDLNRDQVVLRPDVVYEVVGSPESKLVVETLDDDRNVIASSAHTLDSSGTASISKTLSYGLNHLRFTVTNPRGFSRSTERLTRFGDVVVGWNAALLEMVRETTVVLSNGALVKPPPPMVAKHLAMVHGAMFDAINAIRQEYEGYAYTAVASTSASEVAAAASAAYHVSRELYSTEHERVLWDRTLAEIFAAIPNDLARSIGMAVGEQAARAMISKRANDGSKATSNYQSVDQPGRWQPTPPEFAAATLPQWPNVTPFALNSGSQFRPAAPPALTSAEYAAAVDQVMRLGDANSTLRTEEQTKIARFWADAGGTATPPGHWNIIASDIVASQQLTLVESARTYALLNYALADAGIVSWDAKYVYDLWRPIDAIREADTDGNPATTKVASWTPLLVTPSFQAYTSGHSTFSAAGARVLTNLFGSSVSFTTFADPGSTGQWPPPQDVSALPSRRFDSFEQAAVEAGMSRIYGGIHFNFDNTAGASSGGAVGTWVTDRLLKRK